MREDLAFAEPRQPQPGHEPAADVGRALVGELLVIDVDGRVGLGEQHALRLPVLEESPRPGVAVVHLVVVARLDAVEDQADDVAGMLAIKLLLQVGIDHVVGRGDHVAQRADVAEVVAEGAEGLNFRHRKWGQG